MSWDFWEKIFSLYQWLIVFHISLLVLQFYMQSWKSASYPPIERSNKGGKKKKDTHTCNIDFLPSVYYRSFSTFNSKNAILQWVEEVVLLNEWQMKYHSFIFTDNFELILQRTLLIMYSTLEDKFKKRMLQKNPQIQSFEIVNFQKQDS